MKRIAMMLVRLFYIAPFWFYKIKSLAKKEDVDDQTKYNFLHHILPKINRAGRVTIKSSGQENIPKENGYILFPNHQGLFDVLALIEASDKPFSVVVKREASEVILIKDIIRLLKGQVIDRDNVRQAMTIIKTMTKEVQEGRNYMIFAEGTRSKNGNELLDFKGGSFKSAMNAKCPIIPVALIDSFLPFDSNTIKPITVQVHFLTPLYYDEYKSLKSNEIAEIVKSRIEEKIQETT